MSNQNEERPRGINDYSFLPEDSPKEVLKTLLDELEKPIASMNGRSILLLSILDSQEIDVEITDELEIMGDLGRYTLKLIEIGRSYLKNLE